MLLTSFSLLIIFLILGVPVSFSLALSGFLGAFITGNMPLYLVAQKIMSGMDSFPLMAFPFFLLAGEIMSKGGMSQKIVAFANSLVGFFRGGIAMVTVVASMIFAGISGSAAADTSAIGSLMVPQLTRNGYEKGFAASLIASAGAIGPIIPPSLNMIVYASVTGDSVGRMFLGGIVPGMLIGIGLIAYSYHYARKHDIEPARLASIKEYFNGILISLKSAIWAIIAPVIILGGILLGLFTATEAGIVAVAYAMLYGFFVSKHLSWKGTNEALFNCVILSGMIMMIMGTAKIYAYIFAVENVSAKLSPFLLGISSNPTVILVIIFFFMVLLGFFLEMLAVLVVVAPIVHPLLKSLGMDPIYFGVILSIASVIGSLTPPVGIQIFVSMGIAKVRMRDMFGHLYPMVGIICSIVLLSILFPQLITFVPNLVFGG